jgi:hypothetical protein
VVSEMSGGEGRGVNQPPFLSESESSNDQVDERTRMRMKVQLLLVKFDRLGGISFRAQVEMFIPRAGTPSTLYLFRSYHGN